jgi:hypothetical protein
MTTNNTPVFHLPTRPYSPIDALNRRAAAIGSPRYVMATEYADYNGHHVTVSWNSYRGYYIAQYYWAERIVLERGSFADCLRVALKEYARGALGASAEIAPRADDAEAIALCNVTESLIPGDGWGNEPGSARLQSTWYTWRHECAAASVRDSANPRALTMVFDWELMQASETRDAYEAALRAKHGRVYQ